MGYRGQEAEERQVVVAQSHQLGGFAITTSPRSIVWPGSGQLCPRPAEEIAVLLEQNALMRVRSHPYGLVTAAKAVGLTHTFAL
jgi:hypothetical protein